MIMNDGSRASNGERDRQYPVGGKVQYWLDFRG